MKLWTLQPLTILKEIKETGTYRCRRELSYNLSKADSLDDKYQWLMTKMREKIGEEPSGVDYPIWSWHTWEGERQCPDVHSAAFLKRTEDKVLLTLEIPDQDVVLTDFNAWQIVLNGGYLTVETDPERLEQLEEYIDSLDGDQLDAAIEESWDNVFQIEKSADDEDRGTFVQATFWELKREYIVEQRIISADEDIMQLAVELRHDLHRHPELSMREAWTKAHLMEFLKEHTGLKIVDRGRWFYAVYHKGDHLRNIAFRADFDAVPVNEAQDFVPYVSQCPGVAHKCGHDGHSAALAAFAMVLDRYGADCNVYLLFQHAEETGQGAEECLSFLQENGIEEIFAIHNMPGLELGTVAVSEGVVQYASTGMTLSFSGKKSHACYPEDGINPAYAISEMVQALPNLTSKADYSGLTLITVIGIQVGEKAFGTSAGEGELLLTVRGEYEKELQDLLHRIEELAEEKAHAHGLTWSVQYEDPFTDCYNHGASVMKVREAASRSGIRLQDLREPFRASEDFGRFTKEIPGAIFYVGAGEEHAALHTAEYDFPDEILDVMVAMYREIVLNFDR